MAGAPARLAPLCSPCCSRHGGHDHTQYLSSRLLLRPLALVGGGEEKSRNVGHRARQQTVGEGRRCKRAEEEQSCRDTAMHVQRGE